MPRRTMTIRHLFAGGWATDFGPNTEAAPDAAGILQIPFLREAKNVFFELNGGVHKVGGTDKVNSSALDDGLGQTNSTIIRGLAEYWKHGVSGAPTQKRIAVAGAKVWYDNADGTFIDIDYATTAGSAWTVDSVPSFATFDDKLIIANDKGDKPVLWDQSTLAVLGTNTPLFGFGVPHKNRFWAAGVLANPSRLYYSQDVVDGGPDGDWDGSGAGFIDIDPGDGDRITALASHKNDLWVFKGPYKGAIHRIAGSAPTGSDAFGRITFIDGLGAAGHNSLFRFRDDLGFVWSDGSVHSLAATAAYGDFNEAALSRPIQSWIRLHANQDKLQYASAATDVGRGYVALAVPVDGSDDPNVILLMDYRFPAVRWSLWTAFDSCYVTSMVDQADDNLPAVAMGGTDGFVRKIQTPRRSVDGTQAISALVRTPYLHYGIPIRMKRLRAISLGIQPKGNFNLTFGWERDNLAQQTTTISQGGGNVLAVSAGPPVDPADGTAFTLDHPIQGKLGGAFYVERFAEPIGTGEFRSIAYEISNNTNEQDLEVYSLTAEMSMGGTSLEN